ncbi:MULTISPECIES: hypothetical protein [unclassified Microcoleus]|uniref:hypothetical protein n=1 Tax=unclassified Microcoleus TaxID=2642155 RepID=UPI002FCF0029
MVLPDFWWRHTLRLGMVRRCEIVGGASRFLVATHPTNWVWCVAVRLLVVLPDFWWRHTLRLVYIWRHGFPLFNDMSILRKCQAKLCFDRPKFLLKFDISLQSLFKF